jgi:alpha-1,2-mannosyltransferase
VATSLFLAAIYLHPRTHNLKTTTPVILTAPLLIALSSIYLIPQYPIDSSMFIHLLLSLHASLFIPLVFTPESTPRDYEQEERDAKRYWATLSNVQMVYQGVLLGSILIHEINTKAISSTLGSTLPQHLYKTIWSHPAQSSISLDVIWVGIIAMTWFFVSGSITTILVKAATGFVVASVLGIRFAGVSLGFVLSLIPIFGLALTGGLMMKISKLKTRNEEKRRVLLDTMGIMEGGVEPGTDRKAPSMRGRRVVVGFWHPYW